MNFWRKFYKSKCLSAERLVEKGLVVGLLAAFLVVGMSSTVAAADTTPPTVSGAASAYKTTVYVEFDEEVDSLTATNAANYSINNAIKVTGVSLRYDKKVAILTTSTQANGQGYTVTVTGVKDLAGNTIGASNTAAFTGLNIASDPDFMSATATSPTTVRVAFTQTLNTASAANKYNYIITGGVEGLVVESVYVVNSQTIDLSVSPMTSGVSYSLRVSYLKRSTDKLIQEDGSTNITQFSAYDPGYSLDKPNIIGVQGASGAVTITWLDDPSITSYKLYRSLDGYTWTLVTSGDGSLNSYSDSGLTNYINYYYKVRAGDGTASIESATAAAFPPSTSPHGYWGVDTSPCAACHVTHAGIGPYLITQPSSVTLCVTCHDGTQSKYDVLGGQVLTDAGLQESPGGPFGTLQHDASITVHTVYSKSPYNYGGAETPSTIPTSIHNVGLNHNTAPGNLITTTSKMESPLECISCHNPHNYDNYRMLKQDIGVRVGAEENVFRAYAVTESGKEIVRYVNGSVRFCGYCHSDFNQGAGSGSTLASKTKQVGYSLSQDSIDLTMHAVNVSKSYSGLPAPNTVNGIKIPYEDDKIICMTCHRAHGTVVAGASPVRNNGESTSLKRIEYMYICESCHDKTNNPY